ncbi:MAG TPA: GNAT family N-acetyltransferase [Burkholderiales bacterium]|nr:GNAT family N-acetyltransferase [Burkholderiales bacterium]
MTACTIRPAGPRDVAALCALARETWRAHYPAIIGEAQTEYMLAQRYRPEIVEAELDREDIRWVVAHDGERMVGFASFHVQDAGELKIDKLYVHPAHQRRGIGGALVERACEVARSIGASNVILAVNKRNANAIAAYRKHGFDIREAVVKDIGEGFVMDDYIMAKKV